MTKPQKLSAWRIRFAAFLAAALIGLGGASLAIAQIPSTGEVPVEVVVVAPDPYGRETPRDAITGLLDALGSKDFERAANYFFVIPEPLPTADVPIGNFAEADGPVRPGASTSSEAASTAADQPAGEQRERDALIAKGAALALKLKSALDSGGKLAPYAGLSNLATGRISDGLSPNFDKVGSIGDGASSIPIILARTSIADGRKLWRVSPETIAALDGFVPAAQTAVAAPVDKIAVAGAPLVDWLSLAAVAAFSFFLFRFAASGLLALLRRLLHDPEASAIYRLLYAGLPPLALYLAVVTFYLTADRLEVAIVARQTLLRYAGIVAWVALAWFALRLVDAVAKFFAARMRRAERRQAVSIITFLRRGAKLLVLAVAAFAVLDTIGLDVTTGLAALGIGGIALALGAQKTIENLVGSITVIADKPVQVGDVARIGDVFGTIEDIGMRSTRVRTNERTVVTIPNGDLAAQRIENYALRDRFLFHQTLGVSYDTDAQAMEAVLHELREILRTSDDIIDDDARVRFHGFGDSSLDIEIFAYFRATDYPASLAMQEGLLFEIMRKLDTLNVEIAFPTRTLNLRTVPTGAG